MLGRLEPLTHTLRAHSGTRSQRFNPSCMCGQVDINLKNTARRAFCYRVRTTAPDRYHVRPATGTVGPQQTGVISLFLLGQPSLDLSTWAKDKMQASPVSPAPWATRVCSRVPFAITAASSAYRYALASSATGCLLKTLPYFWMEKVLERLERCCRMQRRPKD